MALGQPAGVDFNYFLNRKYALLAQNADATTQNAASGAITANAQALSATASAGLDNVRAKVMPDEVASQIRLQNAQGQLYGEQAKVVAPESRARIGQIGAETRYTTLNGDFLMKDKLTPGPQIGGALSSVLGGAAPTMSLSGPTPRRRLGETEASYMDRINGF